MRFSFVADEDMTCMDADTKEDETFMGKTMENWAKNSGGTLDELNFSHIFDYNAIEQIANGLEKMVQSWSTAQEERAEEYARVSVSLDQDSTKMRDKAEAGKSKEDYVDVGGMCFKKSQDRKSLPGSLEGLGMKAPPPTQPIKEPVWPGSTSVERNATQASIQNQLLRPSATSRAGAAFQKTSSSFEGKLDSRSGLQNGLDLNKESSSPMKEPRQADFGSYAHQHSQGTRVAISPQKVSEAADKEGGKIGNLAYQHAPGLQGEQFPAVSSVSQFSRQSKRVELIPSKFLTEKVSEFTSQAVQSRAKVSPGRREQFQNHNSAKGSCDASSGRSFSQVKPRCEDSFDNDAVEMQKVYIDVETNLERSFSQKGCSTANGNADEDYAPVTKLFEELTRLSQSGQKNVTLKRTEGGLECQKPRENPGNKLLKEFKSFSRETESGQLYSKTMENHEDFHGGAVKNSSTRESLEIQNSSMLIPTRHDEKHEEKDRRDEELGKGVRIFSTEGSHEDRNVGLISPANQFEPEQANESFITSSSYWRVEPEALSNGRGRSEEYLDKQNSFISDTSYERPDMSNTFEERPLKRKKETLDRDAAYESEFESSVVEESLMGDSIQPHTNESMLFPDDAFENVQEGHFATLARTMPGPLEPDIDDSKEAYKNKVEELQIALLECAAEYEVKMVEMEMKMLHLKSKYQFLEQEPPQPLKSEKLQEWTTKRLETFRRQNFKLQRDKELLSREMVELRKKERQLDLLRKNMDDSLQKVNSLQRELVKKEEELVDSQLKEKEAKAHLYQVEAALQQAEASQIDQSCVLNLLMGLSQWLQNVKKAVCSDPAQGSNLTTLSYSELAGQIEQYEDSLSKLIEEYVPQKKVPQLGFLEYMENNPPQECLPQNEKEVQALQDELEKLACRRSTF